MFPKQVLLSLQCVLTEVFFLSRQHCALFMSSERCLNLWRCSCQPPKTCWTRRTTVIAETLLGKARPLYRGQCTCYLSLLFGGNFRGVFVWFVSFHFYTVKANVTWKEGMCMTLLVNRTLTRHRWQKELFHCVLIHLRVADMGKFDFYPVHCLKWL